MIGTASSHAGTVTARARRVDRKSVFVMAENLGIRKKQARCHSSTG
jgi:hypothetical protein